MLSTKGLHADMLTEPRLYEVMYAFAGAGCGLRNLEATRTSNDDLKRFTAFVKKNPYMLLGDTSEDFAFMDPLMNEVENKYQMMREKMAEVGFDTAARTDYTKETLGVLSKHVSAIMKGLCAVEFSMQKGYLMESMKVLRAEIRG